MKSPFGFNKIDKEFPESEIATNYDRAFAEIKPIIDKFVATSKDDPNALLKRWADIREMILNIDSRIHYWENRRVQFLQITLGILAASIVALVTIIPKVPMGGIISNLQFYLYFPFVISCFVLFIGSIWLLIIWNRQNNPNYPFTKGYKTWRWHYRHAETTPMDTKTNYSMEEYRKQINIFINNMKEYKIKTLECNPAELLDQDLSQLYLLITDEKFKVKYVSDLRDKMFMVLFVSLMAGFGTVIFGLFIY